MTIRVTRERQIASRLAALARALPGARRGEVTGIHKARVATRRLREALPILLAHAPGRRIEKLRRRYRALTRVLGPVRELDVTLGLLPPLHAAHPEAADALEWLAQDAAADRARRFEDVRAVLEKVSARTLAERALALVPAGTGLDERRALAAGRRRLVERVARRGEVLAAAVAEAGALYAPGSLHAVRIAVKKLRYALELAYDMRVLPARRPIRQLKVYQEALGDLHDLQVLIGRIHAAQARAPRTARHLLPQLAPIVEALEHRCRELHARYVAQREPLLVTPRLRRRAAPATAR